MILCSNGDDYFVKKKIINVIFNIPLLLLGVTFLAIQEYIMGIILLVVACITFYYITTSTENNINTRIRNIIIAYIILFTIWFIIDYIMNCIADNKEKKIFDNDIKLCYTILNEEHDYKKFENLIEKHNYTFKNEAYSVLQKLIDEKIEQSKTEIPDNEFVSMLNQASIKNYDIKKKAELLKDYNELAKASESIKDEDYIEADNILTVLIFDTNIQEIKDNAKSKQEEIKDLLSVQVIDKAQELINKKEYSSAMTFLSRYRSLKNDSIINMYNEVSKEVSKEKQAQLEKERLDFEIYCYFNMIAWRDKSLNDEQAYSKCANKFGITKEQAKESYHRIEPVSYSYQDKYPDIYEKYASQYYN